MSETQLLNAVRDQIVAHEQYEEHNCGVEIENIVGSTVPDVYITVTPGPITTGDAHPGGAVEDICYGVNVGVLIRTRVLARDRYRSLIRAYRGSFSQHLKYINQQIDFGYTVITNANTRMVADGVATGTCDTFIEPLRLESFGDIRPVTGAVYGSAEGEAGFIRTIRYRGARRMVAR